MARPNVLVDSNFLYALFRRVDPDYATVQKVFDSTDAIFIVPQVVLTEVTFLFDRMGGAPLVAGFLELFVYAPIQLESVTYADLKRAGVLLRTYTRTKIEFVDCCIAAIAERLDIVTIATLDRRDFSIIRTKDNGFYTLLP
jgi:predicted nucleic acid-binding protein